MTYKINPFVELIDSPITVFVDSQEQRYENGKQLSEAVFSKNYIIDRISTNGREIVIYLKGNIPNYPVNWEKEQVVSFF